MSGKRGKRQRDNLHTLEIEHMCETSRIHGFPAPYHGFPLCFLGLVNKKTNPVMLKRRARKTWQSAHGKYKRICMATLPSLAKSSSLFAWLLYMENTTNLLEKREQLWKVNCALPGTDFQDFNLLWVGAFFMFLFSWNRRKTGTQERNTNGKKNGIPELYFHVILLMLCYVSDDVLFQYSCYRRTKWDDKE